MINYKAHKRNSNFIGIKSEIERSVLSLRCKLNSPKEKLNKQSYNALLMRLEKVLMFRIDRIVGRPACWS